MRTFLEEIGTHWFPVEFDPYECMKREQQVQNLPFFCERLLKTFTAERLRRSPEIKIVDLPESLPSDFFGLGHFMDWLAPQRDEIIEGKAQLGRRLKEQIVEHRAKYDKDHSWLDTTFPQLTFRPDCPATFVYINLVRLLILESKGRTMMPNDGIDFGQAVIGSAYFIGDARQRLEAPGGVVTAEQASANLLPAGTRPDGPRLRAQPRQPRQICAPAWARAVPCLK
jgi:hypothetical protein